jgi:hypothetical protein
MKLKKPFDKECDQCKCTFKARTKGKKYCSLSCKSKAWYQVHKYRLADQRNDKKILELRNSL